MDIDPDNPLALEIQMEAAAAYFQACKKMVAALEAFKVFDQTFQQSPQNQEQTRRRMDLLEEAAERVYFVIIQRDAMKFTGYEKFFEDYEIPKEVKSRIGVRRNG